MKRILFVTLMAAVCLTLVFAQGGNESATNASFVPSRNIDWICTSSPGGGSDIFTRNLMDIMVNKNLVNGQKIIVQYKTDGAGEIGRNQVATMKAGEQADHTLLTFNSGDLMPMCKNTNNRIGNFQPIAFLAVDKHLIFIGEYSKYKNFKEVIAALKAGKNIVLGGSKGDDVACHAALAKEIGVPESQFSYIAHDSSSAAITAILGGHVDLLICKPAAAIQYVEAGKLTPILALSSDRFTGVLNGAPTLVELGYKTVEVPNWRSVVGPASMSPAAVAYWSDVFKKVSETSEWQDGYINKQKLISNYMDSVTFKKYVDKYQADYLASIGKTK